MCIGIEEIEVAVTTTEQPVQAASCKPCECNCNQSNPVDTETAENQIYQG